MGPGRSAPAPATRVDTAATVWHGCTTAAAASRGTTATRGGNGGIQQQQQQRGWSPQQLSAGAPSQQQQQGWPPQHPLSGGTPQQPQQGWGPQRGTGGGVRWRGDAVSPRQQHQQPSVQQQQRSQTGSSKSQAVSSSSSETRPKQNKNKHKCRQFPRTSFPRLATHPSFRNTHTYHTQGTTASFSQPPIRKCTAHEKGRETATHAPVFLSSSLISLRLPLPHSKTFGILRHRVTTP